MAQDLAGFLGLAALMVTLVAWLRSDIKGLGERLVRIEAMQASQGDRIARVEERLTHVEERQTRLEERFTRVEAMLADLGERMARIEGAVVGAPGRPVSERAAALEEARAAG